MNKPKDIELTEIRTDGGTQPRCGIDNAYVGQLAERLDGGEELPPADVFHDGETYWLADGFHRFHAHKRAGILRLNCNIHQGTKEDAQWFSFGANKAHDAAGLRRTNEDKQRAVEAALRHPKAERMSNRLIAEHVGVSETMVTLQRKAICVNNADAPAIREVTRNGKTYEMNVSNINKNRGGGTMTLERGEKSREAESRQPRPERTFGGISPKAMQPIRMPNPQGKVTALNLSHDPEKAAPALLSAFGESYCKLLVKSLADLLGQEQIG